MQTSCGLCLAQAAPAASDKVHVALRYHMAEPRAGGGKYSRVDAPLRLK